MVMTRQQPFRRPARKSTLHDEDGDDDFGLPPQGTSSSAAARSVRSPPPVAAAAAAAASSSPKREGGLSLYEELLKYHRENPEEEDRSKQERERRESIGTEDGDRKPAARPPGSEESSSDGAKPKNGTYRVPVSREYFAAKDREGSPVSPKPRLPASHLPPNQLTIPNLTDWEDPRLMFSGDSGHNSFAGAPIPEERPMPYLDSSFHDLAEDEALARQLQAEEEERLAACRRAAAANSNVHMPPVSSYSTAPHQPPASYSRDEELARQFAGLSTTATTPVLPATLHDPSNMARAPSVSFQPHDSHHHHPEGNHSVDKNEDILKQQKILQEIMEANEREQLEWAMLESKRSSAPPPRARDPLPSQTQQQQRHRGPGITDLPWQAPRSPAVRQNQGRPTASQPLDWEASQRAALEEYERQQRQLMQRARRENHTTGHIELPSESQRVQESRQRSHSSESKLQRGQQETANAIRDGRAHIVRCRGCSGRLQAPVHYSMVYCPKCGHVSPGDPM